MPGVPSYLSYNQYLDTRKVGCKICLFSIWVHLGYAVVFFVANKPRIGADDAPGPGKIALREMAETVLQFRRAVTNLFHMSLKMILEPVLRQSRLLFSC